LRNKKEAQVNTTRAQEVADIMALPWCSVEDAAKVLGVSRTQAYRAVNSGEIHSIRIGKRHIVPTDALKPPSNSAAGVGAHAAA
jgi:excisionase family DNA binding protein